MLNKATALGYIITENPAQSDIKDPVWHDVTDVDAMDLNVDLEEDDDAVALAPR